MKKLGPYTHKAQGYRYFVYMYPDGRRKTVYEHREKYEEAHGVKLPSTTHIHHVNENKVDNMVSNLEPLTASEHCKKHHRPPRIVKLVCAFCGKEFERCARKVTVGKPHCSRHCLGLANAKRSGFRAKFSGTIVQ